VHTDRLHRRAGFVVLMISLCLLAAKGRADAAPEAICSDPAVVYCDNFEDRPVGTTGLQQNIGAKTGSWDMSDFVSVRVSSNIAFDGTKSMLFDYPACSWTDAQGGTGCGAAYGMAMPQFNLSEFYMRHYVYWAPGYTWSSIADKHIAFLDSTGSRAPWAFHTMWGSRTPHHVYEPIDPPHYDQNAIPAVVWTTGQWYCLEIHIKQGAGNAILEGWIDGVKKWDYTNANFPNAWTGGNSGLMVSGYWNTNVSPGSRGAQQRYFDNIVVSTQRIGCLGSPPPASAPPSAPPGVTVR
jgi:hypothetical protein